MHHLLFWPKTDLCDQGKQACSSNRPKCVCHNNVGVSLLKLMAMLKPKSRNDYIEYKLKKLFLNFF